MTWVAVADALSLFCLLVGALLCLSSGVGLLRLPNLYLRMHAGAKPQALGVLLMLLGVGLRLRSGSDAGMLLLAAFFQLMTIPVSSHLIARARHRLDDDVPEGTSSHAEPGAEHTARVMIRAREPAAESGGAGPEERRDRE